MRPTAFEDDGLKGAAGARLVAGMIDGIATLEKIALAWLKANSA